MSSLAVLQSQEKLEIGEPMLNKQGFTVFTKQQKYYINGNWFLKFDVCECILNPSYSLFSIISDTHTTWNLEFHMLYKVEKYIKKILWQKLLIDDVIVMWRICILQNRHQQKLKNDIINEICLSRWEFQVDTTSRTQNISCSLFFSVKLGLSVLLKNGLF